MQLFYARRGLAKMQHHEFGVSGQSARGGILKNPFVVLFRRKQLVKVYVINGSDLEERVALFGFVGTYQKIFPIAGYGFTIEPLAGLKFSQFDQRRPPFG
jgi:hypothetical protein